MSKPSGHLDSATEIRFMREALRLARRGYGHVSPNPMVGAILVRGGVVIGKGWHRRVGGPHAEIEALSSAVNDALGSTLFVTLEPCSTHGRTPPCTDAIIAAGIRRVIAAAEDPNPAHRGKGFAILRKAEISVRAGLLAEEATDLNEAFNHWIVHRTPFVTIKAAMSLDGKIATAGGESKWITGEKSREYGMKLRAGADAIVVGVNTIIQDNPSLTVRLPGFGDKATRRIVLDPHARSPLDAKVFTDSRARFTTLIVTGRAPKHRVKEFSERSQVIEAPEKDGIIDLRWLLRKLGKENVASLLVEGGGETNAGFLECGLVQRVQFFYAPMVLGGRSAAKAVGGKGVLRTGDAFQLRNPKWRRLGPDLLLTALVDSNERED